MECEFVDQVPEDYLCKLCKHVAREPTIASCCIEVLCKACIDAVIQDKKPCPSCESNDISILGSHKKYQVKISNLNVKHLLKDGDSEQTGQLRHLNAHLDISKSAANGTLTNTGHGTFNLKQKSIIGLFLLMAATLTIMFILMMLLYNEIEHLHNEISNVESSLQLKLDKATHLPQHRIESYLEEQTEKMTSYVQNHRQVIGKMVKESFSTQAGEIQTVFDLVENLTETVQRVFVDFTGNIAHCSGLNPMQKQCFLRSLQNQTQIMQTLLEDRQWTKSKMHTKQTSQAVEKEKHMYTDIHSKMLALQNQVIMLQMIVNEEDYKFTLGHYDWLIR